MLFSQRIRLAIDIEDPSSAATNLLDSRGRTPMIFRAGKIQIELGFYSGATFLTDLSSIAFVGVGFKSAANPAGDYLAGPYLAAPNAPITEAEWISGDPAKCHATFDLTPDQTNVGSGQFSAQLVIFTQDSGGVKNPLGSTKLAVYESGIAANISSSAPAVTRFALPLQLPCADGLYYTLSLVPGADGKPTISISDTGVA